MPPHYQKNVNVNDKKVQWSIIKTEDEIYAIENIFASGYFDGRNPEHHDPLITNRNPVGDIYLQWSLEKCGENEIAFKSKSGRRYIDCQNSALPLLKNGNPSNDPYMRFVLIACEIQFFPDERFFLLPHNLRKSIFLSLLLFYRIRSTLHIKIPKFVSYEILKHITNIIVL